MRKCMLILLIVSILYELNWFSIVNLKWDGQLWTIRKLIFVWHFNRIFYFLLIFPPNYLWTKKIIRVFTIPLVLLYWLYVVLRFNYVYIFNVFEYNIQPKKRYKASSECPKYYPQSYLKFRKVDIIQHNLIYLEKNLIKKFNL